MSKGLQYSWRHPVKFVLQWHLRCSQKEGHFRCSGFLSLEYISAVLIPYEDVVTQLAADTLSTESSLGFRGARFRCGTFSQLALIKVKVGSRILIATDAVIQTFHNPPQSIAHLCIILEDSGW